jgi:hypothetical protein
MPRNVAIVVDPDYADRLEKLAFHTPVWIVDTPPNRGAAEHAWHTAIEWPHITVTLFRALGDPPTREDWSALLEQIGVVDRAFDVVDVIASPLTPEARAALERHGFEKFDPTESGFRAGKPRRT